MNSRGHDGVVEMTENFSLLRIHLEVRIFCRQVLFPKLCIVHFLNIHSVGRHVFKLVDDWLGGMAHQGKAKLRRNGGWSTNVRMDDRLGSEAVTKCVGTKQDVDGGIRTSLVVRKSEPFKMRMFASVELDHRVLGRWLIHDQALNLYVEGMDEGGEKDLDDLEPHFNPLRVVECG